MFAKGGSHLSIAHALCLPETEIINGGGGFFLGGGGICLLESAQWFRYICQLPLPPQYAGASPIGCKNIVFNSIVTNLVQSVFRQHLMLGLNLINPNQNIIKLGTDLTNLVPVCNFHPQLLLLDL